MSWVTLRNFKDALARETISFTTSIVGYEIEPGDIVSVDAGFKTYMIRVIESMKGANWTNRIRGEPVLRCAPPLFTDPSFALVVFLLGPIGTDASSVFIDEGTNTHALTTNGNAQVDSGFAKFSVSAQFDGTGDWISAAPSADWQLAADNNDPYTVEAFIRINSGGSGTIAAVRPAAGSPTSWVFFVNGSGNVVWASSSISSAGSTFDCIVTSSVTIATDTWYFAAVDHDATGKVRMYVGTSGIAPMVGSDTPADSSILPSGDLLGIGARGAGGGVDPFNGRIEELRITKGAARYASDGGAVIPTERFPRD